MHLGSRKFGSHRRWRYPHSHIVWSQPEPDFPPQNSVRFNDQTQNLQCIHWRMRHHIGLCAVVEVVWETCNLRVVGSIVPSLEQGTFLVLPVMAIFCHYNLSSLHFNSLGQLQKVIIDQRQAIAHEAKTARGIVFPTHLLDAFHFWTPQSRQQDAIKIHTDMIHTSFSSSRRSECSFC